MQIENKVDLHNMHKLTKLHKYLFYFIFYFFMKLFVIKFKYHTCVCLDPRIAKIQKQLEELFLFVFYQSKKTK